MSYIGNPEGEVGGIKLAALSRAIKAFLNVLYSIQRAIGELTKIFAASTKKKRISGIDLENIVNKMKEIEQSVIVLEPIVSMLDKVGFAPIVQRYAEMREVWNTKFHGVKEPTKIQNNLGLLEQSLVKLRDELQASDFELPEAPVQPAQPPRPRGTTRSEKIVARSEAIPTLRAMFLELINAFNDLVLSKDPTKLQKARHEINDNVFKFSDIVRTLRLFKDKEGLQMADGLMNFTMFCTNKQWDVGSAKEGQALVLELHQLLPTLMIAPPFKNE
jgi:hypothetical protein